MKIRIKVKTIILIVVLILVVVPIVNLTLAEIFNETKPEVAEKLYDYYLKYPVSFQKDEVLYKRADTIISGLSRYRIMMGMKMGERILDYDTIDKAINSYKEIIEDYPKSKKYTLAYKSILDLYIYNGDLNNLEDWIEWGKSSDKNEIRDISMLYEGYVYFANREYTKAEDMLSSFVPGDKDIDYMYYFLRGHIEFARENFQKANEYYGKAGETRWRFDTTLFGGLVPSHRKSWLEELDYKNGKNKIKGRVTVDGVGIPFVEVYLQKSRQGYSSRGIDFVATTDKDGYYETIGVKDGKYDLGIGVGTGILFEKAYLEKNRFNFEVLDDVEYDFQFSSAMKIIKPKSEELVDGNKFEVEWEEVQGAEFYRVKAVGVRNSSMFTTVIMDEKRQVDIRGNNAVFDIEILKHSPSGYSIDENGVVSPGAIMGYVYSETTVYIMVDAYDENENMLSSSAPMTNYYDMMPSLKVGGEQTEGEKLISKVQYKEAIDHYENLLLDDEENIEALSYLAKLYIYGWGEGTSDAEKAINYGKKVYDITGNADVILRVLDQMTSKNYRENKEIVKELFDMIPKEYRDEYFYWYRGAYYSSLGEFEKAREDLLLADNIRDSDIVYIDLYLGEYERAIDFLKNKDVKLYYMSKGKLIEGIELLSQLDKNDKEYIMFKEYLSRLLKREEDYEGREEDFRKVYSAVKNPGIKIILNEIKEDNHWD
ncbi:hypothetical protein [Tissierella praeacuta]|uniref:hypothetical protein n=1 Tax=Tissierella praeacuta TaxID=43131 RepID=UPI003341F5B8